MEALSLLLKFIDAGSDAERELIAAVHCGKSYADVFNELACTARKEFLASRSTLILSISASNGCLEFGSDSSMYIDPNTQTYHLECARDGIDSIDILRALSQIFEIETYPIQLNDNFGIGPMNAVQTPGCRFSLTLHACQMTSDIVEIISRKFRELRDPSRYPSRWSA